MKPFRSGIHMPRRLKYAGNILHAEGEAEWGYMENKKTTWLIYTVLVGLIPIIARVLVWGMTSTGSISFFSASDFIAFGLVLHISNINEVEHLDSSEKNWKTAQNGISILFITLYSILFSLIMLTEGIPNLIDIKTVSICVVSLSVISFLISYSVYDRISRELHTEASQ
ncbi:TPA: hypothetical protein ACSP3H_001912 [Aeromonas veronii]|uniref:hypothetical protein n=1 Tax=Aeromonas allosaccharophila TaxID=656 RepID=UPI003D1A9E7C